MGYRGDERKRQKKHVRSQLTRLVLRAVLKKHVPTQLTRLVLRAVLKKHVPSQLTRLVLRAVLIQYPSILSPQPPPHILTISALVLDRTASARATASVTA